MKRLCNEGERQLLYNNRDMIYKGMYNTEAKGGYAPLYVGIAVSMAVFILGLIPIFALSDELRLGSHIEIVMAIWLSIAFSIPNILVYIIMSRIKVKRQIKRFVSEGSLVINGATVVGVSADCNMVAYIEDGYVDVNGQPIIIDYPVKSSELQTIAVGMRMIVMYNSETSFQLMRLNQQLAQLIPLYDEKYPLQNVPQAYRHVPHPNADKIAPMARMLSTLESERMANILIEKNQRGAKTVMVVCSVIFVLAAAFLSFALGEEMGVEPLVMFLISLVVCGGFFLLLVLCRMLGKAMMRRSMRFQYVSEVLFRANNVDTMGTAVAVKLEVFEWSNGQFVIAEYPGNSVHKPVKYGDIVYKLINDKGKCMFLKKEDVQ